MKNLLYLLVACAILAGCGSSTNVSIEDVKSAVEGQNFTFVDKKNTQVPVYLTNGCLVNLKQDYAMLFDHYELKEADGKVSLVGGSQSFLAKPTAQGGLELVDEQSGEKFMPAAKAATAFSTAQLQGEWSDSYAYMVKDNPEKQPATPCPGQSGFLVPTVAFSNEGSVHTDYCGSKTNRPFLFNESTGMLIFDDPCAKGELWTIKQLTDKELVVDIWKKLDGKDSREFGKRFFKP